MATREEISQLIDQYDRANSDLERLQKQKLETQAVVDTARQALQVINAQIDDAKAQLDSARAKLKEAL